MDLEKLEKAGSRIQFFACFVNAGRYRQERWEKAYREVFSMIDWIRMQANKKFRCISSIKELEQREKEKQISGIITVAVSYTHLMCAQAKGWRSKEMFAQIDAFITWVDDRIWGLPLITLILVTGCYLTIRLGLLPVRHLGKALKFMVKHEEEGLSLIQL